MVHGEEKIEEGGLLLSVSETRLLDTYGVRRSERCTEKNFGTHLLLEQTRRHKGIERNSGKESMRTFRHSLLVDKKAACSHGRPCKKKRDGGEPRENTTRGTEENVTYLNPGTGKRSAQKTAHYRVKCHAQKRRFEKYPNAGHVP